MPLRHRYLSSVLALGAALAAQAAPAPRGMEQILATAPASAWRKLDPAHLLVMRLPQGRVVIELAPRFAPAHVANIEALARAHYWNGLAITRVQDDFVTQWGDPNADTAQRRALPAGLPRTLPAEYERAAAGLDFTRLPDGDVYAPEVGFVHGFPVGENPRTRHAWLLHCYGMVGVGRDNPPDTGNGAELYVVIGQAPRQLDRNIAVVGRVVQGMDLLSALPRGHGPLGFYRDAAHRTRILSMRMVNTLPATRRPRLQALRTDTPTFTALIAARRNRRNPWFVRPAGRIGVCNVPLPVRELPPPAP
ncbi:peptidylprolyl isomerase [Metallibacterium sp.]|uniref:peptidylprolyl isomerase n=1 Tax=Metallibacterium sp. TaxID=2940281 RepID=UPI002631648D|nr:peptidylprolyl isomerase [Metallibacterium sp.]